MRGGERGADGDRQALAERAGGEVDAGQAVLRVHAEQVPSPQYVSRSPRSSHAAQRERGVERERRVALRQHEPIAVGVARFEDPQHPP